MASARYHRAAAELRKRRRTTQPTQPTQPTEREYAVVGRTDGATYTIWHVQPTPDDDPAARNGLLDELASDAEEDWGRVTTVYATSPDDAADRIRREQARIAGLDTPH